MASVRNGNAVLAYVTGTTGAAKANNGDPDLKIRHAQPHYATDADKAPSAGNAERLPRPRALCNKHYLREKAITVTPRLLVNQGTPTRLAKMTWIASYGTCYEWSRVAK